MEKRKTVNVRNKSVFKPSLVSGGIFKSSLLKGDNTIKPTNKISSSVHKQIHTSRIADLLKDKKNASSLANSMFNSKNPTFNLAGSNLRNKCQRIPETIPERTSQVTFNYKKNTLSTGSKYAATYLHNENKNTSILPPNNKVKISTTSRLPHNDDKSKENKSLFKKIANAKVGLLKNQKVNKTNAANEKTYTKMVQQNNLAKSVNNTHKKTEFNLFQRPNTIQKNKIAKEKYEKEELEKKRIEEQKRKIEKKKAEKEREEKAKREKAEKIKAEKEKAEKIKAEREKVHEKKKFIEREESLKPKEDEVWEFRGPSAERNPLPREKMHLEVSSNYKRGMSACFCIISEKSFAFTTESTNIDIYSLLTLRRVGEIRGAHEAAVTDISLMKDGSLGSASRDGNAKIWKIEDSNNEINYKLLYEIIGHYSDVNKIIQLSDNRIGTCSSDDCIKIWEKDKCIKTLYFHKEKVLTLFETSDGKYIVSGGYDQRVIFTNSKSYEKQKEFSILLKYRKYFSIHEIDKNRLAVEGTENIKIINLSTLQEECCVASENGRIFYVIDFFKKEFLLYSVKRKGLMILETNEFVKCHALEIPEASSTIAFKFIDDSSFVLATSDGVIQKWVIKEEKKAPGLTNKA